MFPYAPLDVRFVIESKGYKVFDGDEYDLNIWGIRTSDDSANSFNDWLCVTYNDKGNWPFYAFPATTDPGLYYRENPINVKGTAILPPGQYRSMWKLGQHRGKYDALVQNSKVTVWRDDNKDTFLEAGPEDAGWHGINCHRASEVRTSTRVDKWSAGCQVLASPSNFDTLMKLCNYAAVQWGDTFTYTLIESKDLE